MKFVDEFRDPKLITRVARELARAVDPNYHYRIMEVCGGHTHAIYRHGLADILPENIELVHGPGCPVCVLPMGRVDDGLSIASAPDVILACFGDMMRVPGTRGTPLELKARGADIRMVYSPLDALRLAQSNPDKHVCFFAIGFETSAPSTALTILRAKKSSAFAISRCSAITSRSCRQSARFSIRPICAWMDSSARDMSQRSAAAVRTSSFRASTVNPWWSRASSRSIFSNRF